MEKNLLADIFVAQVLVLAGQLKLKAESKGTKSSSDYTSDAIRLIRESKTKILASLT